MIRNAKTEDVSKIMKIVDEIKKMMKQEGNPQWHASYPLEEDFFKDIQKKELYVYEEENQIKGFLCIKNSEKEEYQFIPNLELREGYSFHRLGVSSNDRHQHIALKLMEYGEKKALENNIKILKGDTEMNNKRMNNLFQKLGYQKITAFEYPKEPGIYNYYEKTLGSDQNEI